MTVFIFDLDDTLLMSNTYRTYNDIKENYGLFHILSNLDHPKFIYTNGTSSHAITSLDKMGILDLFDGIFARDTLEHMKPHYKSFNYVNNFIKKYYPNQNIIFFDDLKENLDMANYFNWITVLINKKRYVHESIDFWFPNIHIALNFFISKLFLIFWDLCSISSSPGTGFCFRLAINAQFFRENSKAQFRDCMHQRVALSFKGKSYEI